MLLISCCLQTVKEAFPGLVVANGVVAHFIFVLERGGKLSAVLEKTASSMDGLSRLDQ